jgi:hypothetical protein
MIMYLFGLADLFSAVVLLSLNWGYGTQFAWFCAAYLVIKAIPFIKDPASIIDIIAAIIIVFAIFGMYGLLSYIAVLWLFQKAVFSFFPR